MKKNNQLIVPKPIHNFLIDHGKKNLPYEVCGMLSGVNLTVQHVWPLKNEVKSQSRFFVSQTAVEETLKKVKEKSEEVLAIYHSHPTTSPSPSSSDIIEHADTNILMVIISFKMPIPVIKCFKILDSTYVSYPLTVKTSY
ncbi:Mov34/MPN/PAD-1 family protein [Halobacillus sp. B23F22_1]|uniref:Mov34/MPN/PAD-1 family protein n=1 Tax=Halobacillus sp. B23F22_1 TaxID=3459514 RepID=UPI00373FAC9C